MTVLLVTGSRNGHPHVFAVLDAWVKFYGTPDRIVLGDARGVDAKALEWAITKGWQDRVSVHFAEWNTHGKKAGMLRNKEMVHEAGPGAICVAFPAGLSVGTRGCMAYAAKRGLLVVEVGL